MDRQPGNMTLQHLQNLFRNKRSNLYLLGGLKRNKRKLSMCQYVRKMMDLASKSNKTKTSLRSKNSRHLCSQISAQRQSLKPAVSPISSSHSPLQPCSKIKMASNRASQLFVAKLPWTVCRGKQLMVTYYYPLA